MGAFFLAPRNSCTRGGSVGVDFGGNGSKHAFVATAILPGCWRWGLASQRIDPVAQDADYLADKLNRVLHRGLCPVWGDPVHLLRQR